VRQRTKAARLEANALSAFESAHSGLLEAARLYSVESQAEHARAERLVEAANTAFANSEALDAAADTAAQRAERIAALIA
jgi:hypothetical protein